MKTKLFILFLTLNIIHLCYSINEHELPENMKNNPVYAAFKENENNQSNDNEYNQTNISNSADPKVPVMYSNFVCDKDLVLNSVRQEVMTTSNYNRLFYRYKYMLIYVTASWCDYCCQMKKSY